MDSIHFVHSWSKERFEKIRRLSPEEVNGFIDDNVWVVRYLPYALGAAGLFVSFRAIRSTSKFTHANQIPGAFVRKNAELRGRLVDANLDGTLSVEHSPIINLPWHRFRKTEYLPLRLAYTRPNVSGIYWLKLNALDKPIKFRIIDRRAEDLLVSLSYAQKPKLNLNDELIARGLATLDPERSFANKTQRKTYQRLEKLQNQAQNSGAGQWEMSHKPSRSTNLVKFLTNSLKSVIPLRKK